MVKFAENLLSNVLLFLLHYFFKNDSFSKPLLLSKIAAQRGYHMEYSSLSERLRELRNDFNYSQAYIAQKLNISRQTYSHYETGRIIPPTDSLRALAELYHISMDVLIPVNTSHNATDESGRPLCCYSLDYDLSKEYMDFINSNKSRFSFLSSSEKHLLYYFSTLDSRDQKDILTFMKLKSANRKTEKG